MIGTVEGDLHDIGKNLVAMLLAGRRLRRRQPRHRRDDDAFVAAVKEHSPVILGMSALLTTTLPHMAETIAALKEAGLRDAVKIMVGGAPVDRRPSPTSSAPTATARTPAWPSSAPRRSPPAEKRGGAGCNAQWRDAGARRGLPFEVTEVTG